MNQTRNDYLPVLHSVHSMRALEARIMQRNGIDAYTLMQQAAAAACKRVRCLWPEARRWRVFCGPGNNGGDGYVLATLARQLGIEIELVRVAGAGSVSAAASQARFRYLTEGGTEHSMAAISDFSHTDVVVDAVFGIGLSRAPSAESATAIAAINTSPAPVFSIDIPSGLNADTGDTPGICVQATATLCLIGWKRGLFTARGPVFCGRRLLQPLLSQMAQVEEADTTDSVQLLTPEWIRKKLPARMRDAHKGNFGRVLILGGDQGMGGAALMAAESCLRSGAGRVSVATHPHHSAGFLIRCPELMVQGVDKPEILNTMLSHADVLAIGPGLGQTEWGFSLLDIALRSAKPSVLDADALNLLSHHNFLIPDGSVLTPHPLEAARLLKTDVACITQDRFASARAIAKRYQTTVVLKGAGSIISNEKGDLFVCAMGNPGMASAGMGDVLSGLIAGLLAQGFSALDATCIGVAAHAQAGDAVARLQGERGMIATDLFTQFRRILNP